MPTELAHAVDAVKKFRIRSENEDYVVPVDSDLSIDPHLCSQDPLVPPMRMNSNMRFFPPPSFSVQQIPQLYK
jgi:hypothetical protein